MKPQFMKKSSYTISDLADEFKVSNRTIRFYEEKGLIFPTRTRGNQRRYSQLDRFRLKWILRGRRFGYGLDEIAKMLGLTDTGTSAVQQIKTTLAYGDKKLKEIEDRIQGLITMQQEIMELKLKLQHRLAELQKTQNSSDEMDPKERLSKR
jgi:DNA-binding transcriptional MerR regulator